MSKVALITGITGQDGSYLTEFLLAKGYTVSYYVLLYMTIYCLLYVLSWPWIECAMVYDRWRWGEVSYIIAMVGQCFVYNTFLGIDVGLVVFIPCVGNESLHVGGIILLSLQCLMEPSNRVKHIRPSSDEQEQASSILLHHKSFYTLSLNSSGELYTLHTYLCT